MQKHHNITNDGKQGRPNQSRNRTPDCIREKGLLVFVGPGCGINLCNFFPIDAPVDGGATSCFIYKKLILISL